MERALSWVAMLNMHSCALNTFMLNCILMYKNVRRCYGGNASMCINCFLLSKNWVISFNLLQLNEPVGMIITKRGVAEFELAFDKQKKKEKKIT